MSTGDPNCPSCGSMAPHDFVMCSRPGVSSFRPPSPTPSRRDFNKAKKNGDVIERYDPLAVDEDIAQPVRRTLKPTRTASTVVNRVFYIDVSLVPPKDIPMYMTKVREVLTPETGKNGFVENAKSVGLWEDFFIPVKGVIPGSPSLWQRIKEFFVGRPPQEISATRIELHQVEVSL